MEIQYNVTVEMNGQKTKDRITKRIENIQGVLDAQIMKDSNFYCPMYTGTLIKSVIISSVLGSGLLTWNTPYAKAQYYGFPNKYKLKNPNATQKWFEAAKASKLKSWVKLVNERYSTNN